MLRRFSAIFSKTGKRAGRAALACILCLAALAGSFVACSAEQPSVSVKSAESEPKAAALPAQAGSMENVKEHWLVLRRIGLSGAGRRMRDGLQQRRRQRGVRARAPGGREKRKYPVRRQLLAPGRCMVLPQRVMRMRSTPAA